jgi:hypothetical protein
LNGTDRADKLLSIGQHYGLRTHFLDMTSDWQAAIWFATHDWTTGTYRAGGDGVIYRFDVQNLIKAQDEANNALFGDQYVRQQAYDMWLKRNSPDGDDWTDWFAAERDVAKKNSGMSISVTLHRSWHRARWRKKGFR